MKRIILTKTNSFIVFILSLLGICSVYCAKEYGTPYANYIIKGKITSIKTNEPIPHIKVQSAYYSTNADASGNYELKVDRIDENKTIQLEFIDDNGPAFGDLQSIDTIADFIGVEFTEGDGNWYSGKAIVNMDIMMKDKEDAN